MVATQNRGAKKIQRAAPPGRVKGETVTPVNTLLLISRLGVTRAHRELGVSTTTLHKARKANVVSKVVEIAATAALSHLGAPAAAAPAQQTAPAPRDGHTPGQRVVFLISVDRSKEQMVREFARMLDAELIAH